MITHESVEFVRQFPKVSIVKNSIGELKLIPSRYTEGKRIGNDVDTKDFDLTPYGNKAGSINAWLSDSRAKIGFGTFVGGVRK